jgi:hypothetical protein
MGQSVELDTCGQEIGWERVPHEESDEADVRSQQAAQRPHQRDTHNQR